jgi:DNA-binding response OmpR family regulator
MIGDNSYSYVLDEDARILVVDDDPILREFACVYLATPSASVQTAANGALGLERLLNEEFDIAVVDIDMPVMNGFQLIEEVRAAPKIRELPIIVCTSLDDIASIDRAYRAGATAFVTKPINWRLLSYQIRYVLRSHQRSVAA